MAKSNTKRDGLTAEYLRLILQYEPNTGLFRWKINRRGRGRRKGGIAGYLSPDGRRHIGIDGSIYLDSRLAWLWMTHEWPTGQIDHKNKNPADTRWDNLRQATHGENQQNKGIQINNRAGLKGVSKRNDCNRWRAEICVNRKRLHLGLFKTPEDAASAYKLAAEQFHGEFARTK